MMGLTLAERRAVTETTAIRYAVAGKRAKGIILDELCATTGWQRNHARKALGLALAPKVVTARRAARPPKYGPDVIAALTVCWTVLGMPAGKRLAPMLGELVAVLRHFGELAIDEDTAALLVSMSAATIDRRLAPERAKYQLEGRCTTKPGSLLKGQIPVRTWAEWNDARPGFVEIDLVCHDGGNPAGPHAFTLTVTDIATGWTENRSMPSTAGPCVLRALNDIAYKMPFPAGHQERRLSRRAEELGGGPHRGWLPPLRHRRRTVATQRNLAAAVQDDQLLLPTAETDIQGPQGRQSVQETRHRNHPVSSRD